MAQGGCPNTREGARGIPGTGGPGYSINCEINSNKHVAGSTRLKAGTATKMALNIISTSVMIKLGKVYGNRMIDLSVSNDKLFNRAIGILVDIGSVDKETAVQLLKKTNGSVKLSLLIALSEMNVIEAKQLLNDSMGNLRTALNTVNSD